MSETVFQRLAIVGIGLIGASVALAARQANAVREIVVCDADADALARAEALGLADAYESDVAKAVEGADAVMLAMPVGATGTVCAAMADALAPGTVVTDVGSVKRAVIGMARASLPTHADLVPAHPLAGTEKSGPEAGFASLFANRWTVVTPVEESTPAGVAKVVALWERMGANVETMEADHHDRVLAVVSHLPHLIAYNIVGTASDLEEVTEQEVIKFSASGFRDFTRIAASDPTMWRDVFLHNREAVLEMLGRFSEDLARLQRAVRWGDGALLHEHFTRTRAIRRGIVEQGQDTDAANFGRDG